MKEKKEEKNNEEENEILKEYSRELIYAQESLEKSNKQYPRALIYSYQDQKSADFLDKIFFNIPNFKEMYPMMLDDKGNLNRRKPGKYNRAFLIIFPEKCDIVEMLKQAQKSLKNLKETKKIPDSKGIQIRIYDGNPLNSEKIIKVTVLNPDPNADTDYYKRYGELVKKQRKKGIDLLLYRSLKRTLPAAEMYTKWRDNKTKLNVWFYLDPKAENKAAPMYKIVTKKYNIPEKTQELFDILKKKYPKENKIEEKTKGKETKSKEKETTKPIPTKKGESQENQEAKETKRPTRNKKPNTNAFSKDFTSFEEEPEDEEEEEVNEQIQKLVKLIDQSPSKKNKKGARKKK